jgi:RNA polymerase primary sigma factor
MIDEELKGLIEESKRYELLKAPRETELVYQYQENRDKAKLMKPDHPEYQRTVRLRDKAKDILFKSNIRLIISIMKKFDGGDLTQSDLFQEGVLGWKHGLDKFDPTKGFRLSTYTSWWIRQKIQRAIQEKGRAIRIPIHIHDKISKIKRGYFKICELSVDDSYDENPSAKELADVCDMSVEEVQQLGTYLFPIESLDKTTGEDDNLTALNYIPDTNIKKRPERTVESSANKDYVRELVNDLNEEDKFFINMRYGFVDTIERTDKEMAELLKIGVGEVSKREAVIIEKLKLVADLDRISPFEFHEKKKK